MLVCPSDHHIGNTEAFGVAACAAADLADGVDVERRVAALAEGGLHVVDAAARGPVGVDGAGRLDVVEGDAVRGVGGVDDVDLRLDGGVLFFSWVSIAVQSAVG